MSNPTHSLTILGGAALLAALLGCGGGGTSPGPTPGTTLFYSNPSYSVGQFALVEDTTLSTSTTLVLDLVGPNTPGSPVAGNGVAFFFTADASRVTWGTAGNGTVFQGANGTVVNSWVKNGLLQGVVANKGLANAVSNIGSGVLATIPLTMTSGALTGNAGLADQGNGTLQDSLGAMDAIAVQVGTLTIH